MNYEQLIFVIYIGLIVFVSIMAFIAFQYDKSLAKKNKERIKEKTLLSLCAFGGALGGFISRIIFRHKTDKKYFSLVIYISLLLHIIVGLFLAMMAFNGGLLWA